MIEKVSAYLGFCLRAGKVVFGVADIEIYKKKIHLVIADGALAENSLKRLVKANERFQAPIIVTEAGLLGELLHKPQVKAVAIKDYNLSKAILAAAENQTQFKFYSGGNN